MEGSASLVKESIVTGRPLALGAGRGMRKTRILGRGGEGRGVKGQGTGGLETHQIRGALKGVSEAVQEWTTCKARRV